MAGKRKSGSKRRSRLAIFVKWSLVLVIWGLVAVAGTVAWYGYSLPDVARLDQFARRPSVTVVAADGSRLATFGGVHGAPVALEDLPPYLPHAVLATEDRRFYSHFGIDPLGVARAMLANLQAGSIRQGGSTITQQVAKNLFLQPERTLKRKIQEAMLALWLENRFSKDQILTIYLNRVYLGAGTYGMDAAAQRYFAKPASRVTLYEAAMLAGLLKAPSRDNPERHPSRAEGRAKTVLASMVAAGFLSPEAADAAASEGPQTALAGNGLGPAVRYFADWIAGRLSGFVGGQDRDLVVVTTLDPEIQRAAEARTAALLAGDGAAAQVEQAAAVVMAPDGAVRAMVGGRDYGLSQFNRATQALRQPGSAFKLFVYLAALENGTQPGQTVRDAPVKVGKWAPKNYGGAYHGDVTVREAAARSLNSAAVRLSERTGRDKVTAAARRLGITSDLNQGPSLALGVSEVTPLELTAAYAVLANGGHAVWPYGIAEVRDTDGNVLYRRQAAGRNELIRPWHLEGINDLLSAVVAWGTGRGAKLDRPAAGKTGTSQESRDAWFVGYTADLVAGVWLGNDDGAPMNRVTGGTLPARLWRQIMTDAHAGLPSRPLRRPDLPAVAAVLPPAKSRDGPDWLDQLLEKIGLRP